MKNKILLSVLLFFFAYSLKAQTYTTGVVNLSSTAGLAMTAKIDVGTLVTLTLTGPSGRWFSLGFNATSMTNGTDVVGVHSAGTLSAFDCQLTGFSAPVTDAQQNWTITSDVVNAGTRTIIATRALNTGDANDYVFPASPTAISLIWARSASPTFSYSYHGSTNRGIATASYTFVPAYIPTNGLVGWWPFNGNANDESGNGNNGTVNGATLTTDRYNSFSSAFYFSNNKIEIPHNSTLGFTQNQGFTVSVWAKKDIGVSTTHLMGKRPNGAQSFNWHIADWFGTQFSSKSSSNIFGAISNQPVRTAFWTHIVGIYESGLWKLYMDGILISSSVSSFFYPDVNTPLVIGNSGNWGGFYGSLDDIGIWNRALTQSEITALYTTTTTPPNPPTLAVSPASTTICAGSSTTLSATANAGSSVCASSQLPTGLQSGLVGYWPFCGNANDASGNGNNGTVNGATLTKDRFGNAGSAYSFDGVDDFIKLPPVLPTQNQSYSVNFWAYVIPDSGRVESYTVFD
ncbi:MAG: LamG-like jellyroll fold domain-containing protein, partial [Flavobacteriales bacterium]